MILSSNEESVTFMSAVAELGEGSEGPAPPPYT